MCHIIIIIIIIIEGVHLRDGQDQAQAEGLWGGVAQAQDDQVTALHREGPWSVVVVGDVVDVVVDVVDVVVDVDDYEEELHKHRMTKSQLSTEKVRGLNLQNNLSMGVILKWRRCPLRWS